MPKSKEILSSSSDDSSLEDEDDKKAKKSKRPVEKKQKIGESSSSKVTAAPPPAVKKKATVASEEEENMFQIGKMRYVRVSCFKGKVLIDIREFYMDKEGDTKPGKKGIALNPEQWNQLKELVPEIDAAIRKF
ncbi:activated RNA polymerase II transcriptional coactivator p15-like [Erpetoichthys calabaricus]|uniref:Activated RNA polymerase II transcriptional coactivator p15 n=1 Tax=Erpetoichthys calabaricus TaxID=27687 RepID=A0A8C4TGW2_ERPCA|nr:activated RNA polymerase II transcriptional coactivator p15-like [Erpetoichthys calabaricus]XP_028670531.1 activated RNA polymerase II transcriptional coactivator p15-like [Erpetoichthys calabaricus]XP_028670532.1 activated RNA polymerase II transcriptional coactivator p15-like [Erpetoichthys calabaricus]